MDWDLTNPSAHTAAQLHRVEVSERAASRCNERGDPCLVLSLVAPPKGPNDNLPTAPTSGRRPRNLSGCGDGSLPVFCILSESVSETCLRSDSGALASLLPIKEDNLPPRGQSFY